MCIIRSTKCELWMKDVLMFLECLLLWMGDMAKTVLNKNESKYLVTWHLLLWCTFLISDRALNLISMYLSISFLNMLYRVFRFKYDIPEDSTRNFSFVIKCLSRSQNVNENSVHFKKCICFIRVKSCDGQKFYSLI